MNYVTCSKEHEQDTTLGYVCLECGENNESEKQKFKLENEGYTLIETKQISFNEFILFFERRGI